MLMRPIRKITAVGLVACLLTLTGLVYPQTVPHAAHHAHHQASDHTSPLCAWLCATGQGVESAKLFFHGLVLPLRVFEFPKEVISSAPPRFLLPSRAPPSFIQ